MNAALARAIGRTRLYHLYNRRFGKFEYRTMDHFIHEYSRRHREVHFLQVGGNDGVTWDPFHYFIRRDGWKGVVVEPQREVYEQLQRTYRNVPGVKALNVAIDATDGVRPLYRFAFSSSCWATSLATFDRERLIANFNSRYIQDQISREHLTVSGDPDDYVVSELVQCLSFGSILAQSGRATLDFLITDVEGYDVQILDTFPFDAVRPANVVFELPLKADPAFGQFLAKLRSYEYDLFIARTDAIAVQRAEAGR